MIRSAQPVPDISIVFSRREFPPPARGPLHTLCPLTSEFTSNSAKTKRPSRKRQIKSDTLLLQMPYMEMIPSATGIPPTDGFMAPNPKFSSAATASAVVSSPSLSSAPVATPLLSRYESQKRRDWNTFGQYLKNHRPPTPLSRCNSAHVLDFLRYLDQFGKTKVHTPLCPFFGHPNPPAPCPCPLRQAWGSLDALIGRLRAAFEENGGKPEMNPFGERAVRMYLREVREMQAKARGISYDKKKRKKSQQKQKQLPVPPEPICRNPMNPQPALPDCAAALPNPSSVLHDK